MPVGHEKIREDIRTLGDRKGLLHGYVFYGPDGVGKKEVAHELAYYLEFGAAFLEHPEEYATKIAVDFLEITPNEKTTIGIDAVRGIRSFLTQFPVRSAYRFVIIDQSELLTPEAHNALLKITEEPAQHGLIICIAKDPSLLPETLTSRLAQIYFGPVKIDVIKEWLLRKEKCSSKEATTLAIESFGSPGLALRLLKDKEFQKKLKLVEKLLTIVVSLRRETIKKLLDDDHFDLASFLDMLILRVAKNVTAHPSHAQFWHALLELREKVATVNVNPRLQLEALFHSY